MPDLFTSKKIPSSQAAPQPPVNSPLRNQTQLPPPNPYIPGGTPGPETEISQQIPATAQVAPLSDASQAALQADTTIKHNPAGLFTSFVTYPEKIIFSRKSPNEEVLLLIRRHWITNIPWILTGVIGAFLPLLTTLIIYPITALPFLTPTLVHILISMYYVFLIGFILTEFVSWFYNLGVVTSERIIDIDYENLTYKSISATELADVEEVHAVQQGFFQSIFNYGDVDIQTESQRSNIEFYLVPRPVQINDMILDMVGKTTGGNH
jgi:hypothetical protein